MHLLIATCVSDGPAPTAGALPKSAKQSLQVGRSRGNRIVHVAAAYAVLEGFLDAATTLWCLPDEGLAAAISMS